MAKVKVNLDIKILDPQLEFVLHKAQYPAFVGGLGSGKTEAGIYRCFHLMAKWGPKFKVINKRYVFGIYEPTIDLIRTILFDRFEERLRNMGVDYVLNKSNSTLEIPAFNTLIIFRSMENEERIIGYEHADFWADELDTLSKEKAETVWGKLIARNRLNKPGKYNKEGDYVTEPNTGCVTTTPEGFRFVYKKWGKTKNPEKYAIIKGKTRRNFFLPLSYVQDLMDQYPANLIEAYLEGEFVNLTGNRVYTSFDRAGNATRATIKSYFKKGVRKEIHIGMDFNINKMSSVICIYDEEEHELSVVDEIFGVLDTPAMIKEINRRYSDYKIYVYPDAAGRQASSTNAAVSDLNLLRKERYFLRNLSKNPKIKDRVMSLNSMFKNGNGVRRLFVNAEKCPVLTENLEQQTYDPATGQPDKKSGMDHMLDSLGYLIWKLYPIRRQLFLGKS